VEHAYRGGFRVDAYGFAGRKVGFVVDLDVVNISGESVKAKPAFPIVIDGIDDRSPTLETNQNGIGKLGTRTHSHLPGDAATAYLRRHMFARKKKKRETGQEQPVTSGVEESVHSRPK